MSSVSQVSKPRKTIRTHFGKRKRGDPKASRVVTRADPIEPTLPRAHRARVALILLKVAVKKQDWRSVSKGIWLLESLKSHSGREIDRYAQIESTLDGEIEADGADNSHRDEKLRTKNDP